MKRTVRAGNRRIEYILIQSVRKDVLLQMLPEGVVRVYAPKQMHLRDVDAIVRQNADQIARIQTDLDRRIDDMRAEHPVKEGSTISVEGRPHTLHLSAGNGKTIIEEDAIYASVSDPQDDECVRAVLRSALSSLALQRIRERLAYYQPRIGGEFGRVTVRAQKSRWGSCSSKGNLSFNWKLIMAPPQVLDYVVIHELCHLHEFNHSPRFWRLVEVQMPEYKSWKDWLKIHGEDLML